MRRGARQSPEPSWGAGWLRTAFMPQLRALEKHSSPIHHPFSTRAFAASMPMTDTAVAHTCAVSLCLHPEVKTYIPTPYDEERADGAEAEGEDPADEDADPPSPERDKVQKPEDADPPGSPGPVDVQLTTKMIKSAAQKVATAKRYYSAACTRLKVASIAFDKKIIYSELRIKTKLTDAQVRNLERNLDLATSNLKEAKYRVTERRADVLACKPSWASCASCLS